MNTGVPRDFHSFRRLPARRPHEVLYSHSPSGVRDSFYKRAGTEEVQAARTDPSAASNRVASANEGGAMPSVPLADPAWATGRSTQDSAHGKFLPSAATRRTAFSRFDPPAFGRIAGSVAAQRTYEQGLAASGPDGTRVLMPPVAVVVATSQDDGTSIKRRKQSCMPAAGPRRIAFGERKNDMSSLIDPYCAAAHRRARLNPQFGTARSVPEATRIVVRPPSDAAISGAANGSLAVSGG